MAITAKKSFTLKKKDLVTSKMPAVGFKKVVAYHKAVAGDLSINLTDLTMPTEMSAAGYTNPSTADLIAADLTFFRDNLALISSARGYLQPGLSYNVSSNTNIVFSDSFGTALEDEIFTIVIDPVAKSGVEFVDGVALPVTGVLPAGQQDFNIGVPFEVNKFPTTQLGVYQIFYDGVLQSRNVGNADADPGADGNYQEVATTGGLASLIRFNVIDNDDEHDIKCIPVGMMIERPNGSMRAELERQQGQINKIVEVLSDVSGSPESTFTAAPSEVDLKTFGDRVLDLEATSAKIDKDNSWTVVQKLLGVTDGSSPTAGKVGELLSSSIVANTVLTNGLYASTASLALPAGDYIVWGHGNFNLSGSDYTTEFTFEISVEEALNTNTDNMSDHVSFMKGLNFSGFRTSSGIYRTNSSSPKTVYLNVNGSRRAGTVPATLNFSNAQLFALRIR